jgi:uncharacterized protein YecE (DUF72 family)
VKIRRRYQGDAELFETKPEFARRYAEKLRALANNGVWFGTSSWVYTGWTGLVYPSSVTSEAALRKIAFREYSRVFPTGCADWSFYAFPSERQIAQYAREAPEGFRLAWKATDLVTLHRYPFLKQRWGEKAGTINEDFLNTTKFIEYFVKRVATLGDRLGPIILEFSPLTWNGLTPAEFLKRLDRFLGGLPQDLRFAVEVRNPELLTQEYLDCLRKRNVAHVLNSWTRMPSIGEQMKIPHVETADFTVVRALLKPGRTYREAVERFQPYTTIHEIDNDTRSALKTLAQKALASRRPTYVYVNNRLEGNAPLTIGAIVDQLELSSNEKL